MNDIKQFEAKVQTVKNSISKMTTERNEFLAANLIQEGQLETSLTKRVFTLPKRIQAIVDAIRGIKNFRKCVDNYYKMSRYLNDDDEAVEHGLNQDPNIDGC